MGDESHGTFDKRSIARGAANGLLGGLLLWAVGSGMGWVAVTALQSYFAR